MNETISINNYLKCREIGLNKTTKIPDTLTGKFYCNFDLFENKSLKPPARKYGGIFNMEYSNDGRLLVAACEERSILIHDASNQKIIKTISDAHLNCVNCVRFIKNNHFVTCSDDTSIKIWDLRRTTECVTTLYGHSSWVKNIEYCEDKNILVTSAFDGSINAWNLQGGSTADISGPHSTLFFVDGIMRTKISPDGKQMVISTTSGYMIIIHDLNLRTLASDLKLFKPSIYRLMQLSEQNFPAGNMYYYYFQPCRATNRVEFIEDFPNKCEVICSLQIHPHGWCSVSRNINSLDTDEFTAVHDLQPKDLSDYEKAYIEVAEETISSGSSEDQNQSPSDIWIGYIQNDCYNRSRFSDSLYLEGAMPQMHSMRAGLIGRRPYKKYFDRYPGYRDKIVKNFKRMTHFKEESISGKGYIKEVCFSSDGRIICSPYDRGIRLLGFNKNVDELNECLPDKPKELETVVDMKDYHKDVVVCCKFSPTHMQLVSGCLSGDIRWYNPVL